MYAPKKSGVLKENKKQLKICGIPLNEHDEDTLYVCAVGEIDDDYNYTVSDVKGVIGQILDEKVPNFSKSQKFEGYVGHSAHIVNWRHPGQNYTRKLKERVKNNLDTLNQRISDLYERYADANPDEAGKYRPKTTRGPPAIHGPRKRINPMTESMGSMTLNASVPAPALHSRGRQSLSRFAESEEPSEEPSVHQYTYRSSIPANLPTERAPIRDLWDDFPDPEPSFPPQDYIGAIPQVRHTQQELPNTGSSYTFPQPSAPPSQGTINPQSLSNTQPQSGGSSYYQQEATPSPYQTITTGTSAMSLTQTARPPTQSSRSDVPPAQSESRPPSRPRYDASNMYKDKKYAAKCKQRDPRNTHFKGSQYGAEGRPGSPHSFAQYKAYLRGAPVIGSYITDTSALKRKAEDDNGKESGGTHGHKAPKQ